MPRIKRDILDCLRSVQLEIVSEIQRVCDRNGIRFFIEGGTLIGAARHKGFIPWDDDLDVSMLQEDYIRFLEVAPRELSRQYKLVTWDTDERYPNIFAKVEKRGTKFIEEGAAHSPHIQGIFVDVFPYLPDCHCRSSLVLIRPSIGMLRRVLIAQSGYTPWLENDSTVLAKFVAYLPLRLLAKLVPRKVLIRSLKALIGMDRSTVGFENVIVQGACRYREWTTPREWLADTVCLTFEDIDLPAPIRWHDYLASRFGDYMVLPPVEQRVAHKPVLIDLGDGEHDIKAGSK